MDYLFLIKSEYQLKRPGSVMVPLAQQDCALCMKNTSLFMGLLEKISKLNISS